MKNCNCETSCTNCACQSTEGNNDMETDGTFSRALISVLKEIDDMLESGCHTLFWKNTDRQIIGVSIETGRLIDNIGPVDLTATDPDYITTHVIVYEKVEHEWELDSGELD